MINAVQIISSWMRTTGHLTDIMDDDYKTLLAQVQLGLDAQRHQALTEAAIAALGELTNPTHEDTGRIAASNDILALAKVLNLEIE